MSSLILNAFSFMNNLVINSIDEDWHQAELLVCVPGQQPELGEANHTLLFYDIMVCLLYVFSE